MGRHAPGASTAYLRNAALLGAATGLRSTVGMAALAWAGPPGLPAGLTGRRGRGATSLALAGELVADKLPGTPSRLEPAGLGGRAVLGATAGALLARAEGGRWPAAAAVATAAALAGARIGHDLRVAAAERFADLPVALAEDTLALLVAGAAVTRR